jgi:flagellin-like protein
MKQMLKSAKGISPILATLLLIVIAVSAIIVTYAWVMTFTSSTTGDVTILNVENVRYYNATGTLRVDLVIRNSGTADAKVVEVYHGTSSSDLSPVTSVSYVPTTQVVSVDSSLQITFDLSWVDGTRYYFKVVTEAGQLLSFSEEA